MVVIEDRKQQSTEFTTENGSLLSLVLPGDKTLYTADFFFDCEALEIFFDGPKIEFLSVWFYEPIRCRYESRMS